MTSQIWSDIVFAMDNKDTWPMFIWVGLAAMLIILMIMEGKG